MEKNETKRILFFDMGYSCTKVCCALYSYKACEICGYGYDNTIGGELIDYLIKEDIKKQIINENNTIDNNDKTEYRILDSIIKCKEKLSADGSTEILLEISSIVNDGDDYDGLYSVDSIDRTLNKSDIKNKMQTLLDNVLKHTKWSKKEKENMEICIIGGSSRIRFIKNILIEYLKKITNNNKQKLTLSLNADECICKGINYYSYIIDHMKLCNNDNCGSVYHYKYIDNSGFKRDDKKMKYEIDINAIIKRNDNFSSNDIKERIKSGNRNEIERVKYEISHIFEDIKKDFCKDYVENEKKYNKSIENILKSKDLCNIQNDLLTKIIGDENNHLLMLYVLFIYNNRE